MSEEIIDSEDGIIADLVPQEDVDIKSMIYIIRDQQVMLSGDLAKLYQVETKRVNEAVKRNPGRFPEDYCFQLTDEENERLRSHFATLKKGRGQHSKYNPYAFTERGALALAYVLTSQVAIDMSVRITDEFVAMRKIIANYQNALPAMMYDEIKRLQARQTETDEKLETLFALVQKYALPKEGTFLCGEVYDAFAAIVDLIQRAKTSIILVDAYTQGMNTLNILKKKHDGVNVTLYTKKERSPSVEDIAKFNEQYPHLTVKTTDRVHDRYLFIDNEEVYHFGPSLKDAGGRTFTFSKMENLEDAFRILQDIEDNLEE